MNSCLRFWLASFARPPWDTGISPPELLEFIRAHPPGRALDLGCGTGTNAIALAQNGWQTTGVDFIARSIHQAERKAQQAGVSVHFLVDSVSHLPTLAGGFDLILDVGCYHGLAPLDKYRYFQNVLRLLAAGGYYLLYGFIGAENQTNLPGITAADVAMLTSNLHLISRVDGMDRSHSSTWLHFKRPPA